MWTWWRDFVANLVRGSFRSRLSLGFRRFLCVGRGAQAPQTVTGCERVDRGRIETQRAIEKSSVLAQGMYENASNADRVRGVQNSKRGILKQGSAHASTLVRAINGQASKDHTGIRFGMFRRKRPGLAATATALEASA
jgi:hypothetical protein